MNALVYERYGGPEVIEVARRDAPSPGPRDVVLRVEASAVNSGDARLRAARFPTGFGLLGRLAVGVTGPRQPVLGNDVVGIVEEVGTAVTEFGVGDRIVAMTGTAMGGHAQQCRVSVDHCVVSVPDAVAPRPRSRRCLGAPPPSPTWSTKPKCSLANGSSSSVRRERWAPHAFRSRASWAPTVSGVCSADNAPLVRSLGAQHVYDYRTEDVFAGTERWDVVIDTIGLASVSQLRSVATPTGRVGLVAGGVPQIFLALWARLTARQRMLVGPAHESPAYVERLLSWVSSGQWKPVVDSTFSWRDGAAAHARVDSGRKRGSVLLTFPETS